MFIELLINCEDKLMWLIFVFDSNDVGSLIDLFLVYVSYDNVKVL